MSALEDLPTDDFCIEDVKPGDSVKVAVLLQIVGSGVQNVAGMFTATVLEALPPREGMPEGATVALQLDRSALSAGLLEIATGFRAAYPEGNGS